MRASLCPGGLRTFRFAKLINALSSALDDLRHTVVSVLMDLGVPPHTVQAIARHSGVKITLKIYAHSNLTAMGEALGKIEGWLSWGQLK
jgi:integrase